ncbi:EscU/YscU/HrcU family type III secretion system export apparatus switch protein [Hydrogenivirga sp.]
MEEDKKKAVALRYRADRDRAPVVVAKGVGELAERIIDLARREGVPILEDRNLIEALLRIEVFEEIPPVLYEAVAKVLVFVQEARKRSSQR